MISIIFVTYNSKDIIAQSLKGLAGMQGAEIILVDNASKDVTCELVREQFPSVKIIENDKNLGYGRAVNQAIKIAEGDKVLILNPDVTTNIEDVNQLVNDADKVENPGCIAPLTDENAEISDKFENVEWVSGAAMMMPKNIFDEVGYFDENIFLYYEETDLLKRICDQGYNIYLDNAVKMPHLVGKSSAYNKKTEYLKYWHSGWSKFYYIKKHYPKRFFVKSLGALIKNSFKYVIYLISFKPDKRLKYSARFSGLLAFLTGKKAFDKAGNPRGLKD